MVLENKGHVFDSFVPPPLNDIMGVLKILNAMFNAFF